MADRLRLYGLYKQSMEGDVAGVMERPKEGISRQSTREEQAEVNKWFVRIAPKQSSPMRTTSPSHDAHLAIPLKLTETYQATNTRFTSTGMPGPPSPA